MFLRRFQKERKICSMNFAYRRVWTAAFGDALLEALCTFIVTDALKEALIEARASGVAFGDVEVTKSGIFLDMNGDRPLPAFSWLQITGRAGKDDFGRSSSLRLVVSERIMNLLKVFGLNHCEVSECDPKKDL